MVGAGCDGLPVVGAADLGEVERVGGGAVAELSEGVVAPGPDGAVVGERHSVVGAGCDGLPAADCAGADLDGGERVGGGAVADLPGGVVAPGVDDAVAQGHGVGSRRR